MRIGVISAMDSEHAQLSGRLQHKTEESTDGAFRYVCGDLGNNQLVLTQCGIGKVNAAVGAVELIKRHRPDCLISTGVAGGIDPMLQVTDVVVGKQVVYHDVWCGEGNAFGQVQGLPPVYDASAALLHHALSLDGKVTESRIHAGLICTGDRFITDREELTQIKQVFPTGMAVDMESAALAQVCHLYGVPFLSFRIISDTPGADHHWQQYTDFWGVMAERSFHSTWTFLSTLPAELSNDSFSK